MIIWVNGAFGVGKTTTAVLLRNALPTAVLFDPEEVGGVIRRSFPKSHPRWQQDFQDYPMWRNLVAQHCIQFQRYTNTAVIVPMTLLNPGYAEKIFTAVHSAGIELRHLVIHADAATLSARIDADVEFADDGARAERVRSFRRRKSADYFSAYNAWLAQEADIVIDTAPLTCEQTAEKTLEFLRT